MRVKMSILGEFRVDVLTLMANEIYQTGYITNGIKSAVFLTIAKRAGAAEYSKHRTITL